MQQDLEQQLFWKITFQEVRKRWWQYLTILVYSILLFILISQHEPWFDEAQAWLLARDANPLDLLTTYLRYEGTPGLWHLLLLLPAKFGLPYITLNIISGLLAICGVFLLVRFSKLPWPLKVLIPFGYFLFYQYAVVARSYVLLMPILALIAIVYQQRREKFYLYTLLLILLAHVSVHSALIAVSLMMFEFITSIREWTIVSKKAKSKYLLAYAAFGLNLILIFFMLIQPSDHSLVKIGFDLSPSQFVSRNANMLNAFLTGSGVLSMAILAISLFWLWRKGLLFKYLLSMFPVMFVFAAKWGNVWHVGIFYVLWVFYLWLSYEHEPTPNKINNWTEKIVLAALVIVGFIHIYWSYKAFTYDYFENYSGSKQVAEYIKNNNLQGKKIYAYGFFSNSILPYFETNIFANLNSGQQPSYWVWSKSYNPQMWDGIDENKPAKIQAMITDKPDVLILGTKFDTDQRIYAIPGYEFIKVFKGNLFWRNAIKEGDEDSYIVFVKED